MQFSPLEACGVVSTVIPALPAQCRPSRDQGLPGSMFLAQLCMAGVTNGVSKTCPFLFASWPRSGGKETGLGWQETLLV